MDGSNLRPPLRDDARFQAREMLEAFEKRKEDILKSARSFQTIPNRAVAGDVADVVKTAKAIGEIIDARRLELTEPYREAAGTVNATVAVFWDDVATELARLEGLVDQFRRDEADRAAAAQRAQEEERRRLRAENAPKPAGREQTFTHQEHVGDAATYATAAARPAAAPIRGAYGARVGTRKHIEAKVVDVTKVPLEILQSTTVIAAIEKVAKDLAKHRETIDGIEITRGDRTQIRS